MPEAWALLVVSIVIVFLLGGIAAYNEGFEKGRKYRDRQEYEAGYARALHHERERVAGAPVSKWTEID